MNEINDYLQEARARVFFDTSAVPERVRMFSKRSFKKVANLGKHCAIMIRAGNSRDLIRDMASPSSLFVSTVVLCTC